MSSARRYGLGDSYLVENIIDTDVFSILNDELFFHKVHHKGGEIPRLIATQGEIIDYKIPVYRHPQDDEPMLTPWTPTVLLIKELIEKKIGKTLNHGLVQKYRNGLDFIGEHSDKTLDVEEGSLIVNFSCGAARTFELKSKVKNTDGKFDSDKFLLPNNSIFVLGLGTNRKFKHAIRKDVGVKEERISITFRTISTFYDLKTKKFVGQGASDTNGTLDELFHAFREENLNPNFDWNLNYGKGFCVSFVNYDLKCSE